MKRKIFGTSMILIMVIVLATGCTDTNEPHYVPKGYWNIECSPSFPSGLLFQWKTTLTIGEAEALVIFNNFELEKPSFEYDVMSTNMGNWMMAESSGEIDPEFEDFQNSETIQNYPGGYTSFEDDFDSLQVDWERMFKKVKRQYYWLNLLSPLIKTQICN